MMQIRGKVSSCCLVVFSMLFIISCGIQADPPASIQEEKQTSIHDEPEIPDIEYQKNLPLMINPNHVTESYEAYWHYKGIFFDLNMLLSDITNLLGEPLSEEYIYPPDHDGPEAGKKIVDYGPLKITAYDHFTSYMTTDSKLVFGPRNIRVGDTVEQFIAKFPDENNPILPFEAIRSMFEEVNGEKTCYEKVLYGSKDGTTPFASIFYNENSEALLAVFYDRHYSAYEASFTDGAMWVYFKNDVISSFSISK
jgi:hypothetical protein